MQSELDKANPPPTQRERFAVHPARLAWKGASGEVCEGDIHASYSTDVIPMHGRVRKPFKWQGALCVCTSITGSGLTDSGTEEHEAYRLVPAKVFAGVTTTDNDNTATAEGAEATRNDPNGFYHGMVVKHGGQGFVLCGPPIRFMAEAPERPASATGQPEQLTLF